MTLSPPPDTDSVFYWLLLHRLPGVTAPGVRRLLEVADGAPPAQWLRWPAGRLRSAGMKPAMVAAIEAWQCQGMALEAADQARRDRDWLAGHDSHLLTLDDPRYPPLLQEIADPPPWLYVRGAVELLNRPQLAVVGSRHPTRQGCADAEAFAATLAGAGFTVTSGLAYGIDAAAHRAALAAGGTTIAVLGTGIDIAYPATHADLAAEVAAAGALVSELPLGSPPRAKHFPSRNRIISGLSVGVLVVEAALRSGSLVTARLALEQNREVFAIPGSIHNPTSRGCNDLIRRGATLVSAVPDILDELRGWSSAQPVPERVAPTPALAAAEAAVLAAVNHQPTPPETIAEVAAQPLPAVLATLSELELLGLVEHRAGAYLRC